MKRVVFATLLIVLSAGCARFHAKPLSATANLKAFENRTLTDPGLKAFLQANGRQGQWPPNSWDLMSLTLAAFYYHPELEQARAAWAVAKSGIITAGQRPNPSVSVSPSFNSTTKPSDPISPWVVTVDLDVPIETAGKRRHRISEAKHLSEAARMKIATAAWEVRSHLRRSLLDLYAATQTEALLKKQLSIQQDNVRLLKLQLEAGAVSPFEVSQAGIGLATTRLALEDAAKKRAEARVQLADAVGLPVKALDGVKISFEAFEKPPAEIPAPEIRRRALLSRADILSALAEYEASQAALQLEIAKQYPDIHLNPGYEYDQSEHKWALGLSLELPVLNRNQGPIAEAEARRREAAARFNALQARVIGEINRAVAGYALALQKVKTAETLVEELQKRVKAAEAMYKLGEISRLAVATTQLELSTNEVSRLNALVELQQSLGLLEDAMQRPIDFSGWRSAVEPKKSEDPAGGGTGMEEKHE